MPAETRMMMEKTDVLGTLRAGELAGATRLDLAGCGLTGVPREGFDLADSLGVLNLSQNRLQNLPDELATLGRLKILFGSDNQFTKVPEVVGACPALSMVGFKANAIEEVPAECLPKHLRWLILTDNQVAELPKQLGGCAALQKLMLSGNRLERLPEEMAGCVNLELVRLASNRFKRLPEWLLKLPKLAWLAVAGNPCSATPDAVGEAGLEEVAWGTLELKEKLGEGASGLIYRALRSDGTEVAVKVFKGAVTSDGLPENEMKASIAAGRHAHLIKVLGKVKGHPQGMEGLVMALLDSKYRNLAGPPSFESCTRDVYGEDLRLERRQVIAMARAMASVAMQLHGRGLMHGDFYAHNMVWDGEEGCLLGDFGGASFYDPEVTGVSLERLEVRAFGCLMEELLDRCVDEGGPGLRELQRRCLDGDVAGRPRFGEILEALDAR
ncbi:leucine-rich repeat-containing protein kinase family protein [Phragmitibacter flavus]|nr:leucine-rich repeat-containing protein kinase family protein [Phragmitibacter flavus]